MTTTAKALDAFRSSDRFGVLDGWRALSIVLVLASHLVPLGPKHWRLNEAAGPMGMALFFTLSGFLITQFLCKSQDVRSFLIRRLFRIVPLAWLGLLVGLWMVEAPPETWLRNLTFTANLPPQALEGPVTHYWSLCVEVQFYLSVALVVALLGRKGLYALPLACVLVTAHRVYMQALVDIVTWRRVDEILAGGMLAMACHGMFGERLRVWIRRPRELGLLLVGLLVALALSSHPSSGALAYARPYIAALLVGVSLYRAPTFLRAALESKACAYLARISFALYVIHHILLFTPLGADPDRTWHYGKRVLLIASTFVLAHLSTHHFEARFIALGHRLGRAAGSGRGQ